MSWARGREVILRQLKAGELSQVTANTDLAERLLSQAEKHLASAEMLAEVDPYLAYSAVHDATRKAMAAILQVQGLRATTKGGHLAVQEAVKAQFAASMGKLLAPVDDIRRTRHEGEYPSESTYIDAEYVREDLPAAKSVVDAAKSCMPHLGVFVR